MKNLRRIFFNRSAFAIYIVLSLIASNVATGAIVHHSVKGEIQHSLNYIDDNSNKINQDYSKIINIKSKSDLLTVAKHHCFHYLTYKNYCSQINFTFFKVKPRSPLAYTNSILNDRGGNYVKSVEFNPSLIYSERRVIDWVIYHELSHVEITIMSKNSQNYQTIAKAATKYFKRYDGREFSTYNAMETLTDCMVERHAHLTVNTFNLPYYLSVTKSVVKKGPILGCNGWDNILSTGGVHYVDNGDNAWNSIESEF